MIFSVRKWLNRGKYILIFLVLTIVMYHLFQFVTSWIEPAQRYKQPMGKAVKVFQHETWQGNSASIADRLIFFYWYGE